MFFIHVPYTCSLYMFVIHVPYICSLYIILTHVLYTQLLIHARKVKKKVQNMYITLSSLKSITFKISIFFYVESFFFFELSSISFYEMFITCEKTFIIAIQKAFFIIYFHTFHTINKKCLYIVETRLVLIFLFHFFLKVS